MKRVAFYGGSFDPVHRGHLAVAHALIDQFALDEFVFLPAFHAPHKRRSLPTPAIDRYAMLCLMTNEFEKMRVSRIEIERPDRPYTFETLTRLKELLPTDKIFFVMGADSWRDITTWRSWELVLTITDHIVVTRPGIEIGSGHVTGSIGDRIIDLRGKSDMPVDEIDSAEHIYFTDAVNQDISATAIRSNIRNEDGSWRNDVTAEVAKYIEKYQIYN